MLRNLLPSLASQVSQIKRAVYLKNKSTPMLKTNSLRLVIVRRDRVAARLEDMDKEEARRESVVVVIDQAIVIRELRNLSMDLK